MPLTYRDCEHCAFTFPARTKKSRYCSTRCRAAAWRQANQAAATLGEQPEPPAEPEPTSSVSALDLDQLADLVVERLGGARTAADRNSDEEPRLSGVAAATYDHLSKAGRQDTPLGLACLVLAARLDNGQGETGSALKALAVGLREMLTSALMHSGAGEGTGPQPGADEDPTGSSAPVDQLAAARAAAEARRAALQ